MTRVLTEMFMMVLCAVSTPMDQNEMHISLVADRGYMDTMIMERDGNGFTVYDEAKGERVKFMSIVPKEGAENVYVCTDHRGQSQTVDLGRGIKDFNARDIRTRDRLRLKTSDGNRIAIERVDEITFFSVREMEKTYVVH